MPATPQLLTPAERLQLNVGPGKYDAVLKIDLFTDVYDWHKGWKMAVTSEQATLDKLNLCSAVRIAPIGNFNVGKTWLIRKLCGQGTGSGTMELPSANDVHTEGLSIKTSKLDNDVRECAFLDTAGLNSPVTSVAALGHMLGETKDSMKAMENMLQELKRQETFIRRVAFEFAQVYLLVVGQISHRDQHELLQLIELASQKNSTKKQVIVVHNLKKMWFKDFIETKDVAGNTYLQSMQKIFKLTAAKVNVAPNADIDQLSGSFGNQESAVLIRHVFLTREGGDGELDSACRNGWVLQHIRKLIQSGTPSTGNILADIAKIATTYAKNLVRLPPGRLVEIRYHSGRKVLVGGEVDANESKEIEKRAKEQPSSLEFEAANRKAGDALVKLRDAVESSAPEAELQLLRDAVDTADRELSEARVAFASKNLASNPGAETLQALTNVNGDIVNAAGVVTGKVTVRPIALGATNATSGDGHVKYNVTRSRGIVGGVPHWIVMVHMTLPGLAPGQLASIRKQLIWDQGVFNEPITPQSADTLKIRFKANIVCVPEKQVASLNLNGLAPLTADGRQNGGAIQVDAKGTREIMESGNRPFPTPAANAGAVREALQSDGSYTLDINIHTQIPNCTWQVEPVIKYARGILTMMVCAEPTDEDMQAPSNQDWLTNENLSIPALAQGQTGCNGSDDDYNDV